MNTANKNGYAYLAACDRVMEQAVQLVRARGIAASIDIDSGRTSPEVVPAAHEIQLTYGRSRRVVTVDHDTFMDPEFFRTLVLHQIQAAVEELAASA